MSELYQIRVKIEEIIKVRNLDEFYTKGQIGLKAGLLIGLISPRTKDNPKDIMKLKKAVRKVLGVNIP